VAWPSSLERTPTAALALMLGLASAGAALAAPVEVTVTDATGRPLADAVVFVDSAAAKAAARPLADVDIVQAQKTFQPMVTAVTVGTAVSFPNRDTVRHHVYSFSPAKRFELKLYVGTPAEPVVFDRPGVAVLGCNIHDDMAAWVVIVETPWYGKTDAQGRVRLPEVPAGRHQLRTWHVDMPVGTPALAQPLVVEAAVVRASVRVGG
jgi:plastocyanin